MTVTHSPDECVTCGLWHASATINLGRLTRIAATSAAATELHWWWWMQALHTYLTGGTEPAAHNGHHLNRDLHQLRVWFDDTTTPDIIAVILGSLANPDMLTATTRARIFTNTHPDLRVSAPNLIRVTAMLTYLSATHTTNTPDVPEHTVVPVPPLHTRLG